MYHKIRNKVLAMLCCMAIFMTMTPFTAAFADESWLDGVYTGIGKGYRNQTLRVAVTITDHAITDITLDYYIDDEEYMVKSVKIIDEIIRTQNPDIPDNKMPDAVSGATLSAIGIRDATKDAIKKAIQASEDPDKAMAGSIKYLDNLINACGKKDPVKYTEDSYAVLAEALAAGKTVRANAAASKLEIDQATFSLARALSGLEDITWTVCDGITYSLTADRKSAQVKTADTGLTSAAVKDSVQIGGSSYQVTAIANNAFRKMSKLKSVSIGKNIKTIGKSAFQSDTKLRNVTISGKSVKTIGKNAFNGIYKKANFKLPKAKKKAYQKLLKKAGAPSKAVYK